MTSCVVLGLLTEVGQYEYCQNMALQRIDHRVRPRDLEGHA